MFSIFIKFGLSRRLSIMYPKGGNILSQNKPGLASLVEHPRSPPFLFDILCNHVIFNHTLIKPFFPADTKYVAILRDPLGQVRSAFYYYKNVFGVGYLRKAGIFEEFIQHQSMFEPSSPYHSYTNNRLSIDLGLQPRYLADLNYVPTFIRHLEDVFDLVLIADRFDESVVLLKRRLHWTVKDILYRKLNTFSRKAQPVKKPSNETLDKFKRFQLFDVAIYEHFLKLFDQKVAQEGQDFKEELGSFLTTQKLITEFCDSKNKSVSELVVPGTKGNKKFTFQKSECKILKVEEIQLLNWARSIQVARLGNP